ncbi:MAG: hypothetical protein IJV27_01635 [Prevotella sp.]|nr:hypothetical protein [Prevotella sp.]
MKTLFTVFLLATGLSMSAQKTLTLGGFDDEAVANTISNNLKQNAYDGSNKSVAPVNYNYKYSGCQTIYTKSELAEMAGGAISAVKFKLYDLQSAFGSSEEGYGSSLYPSFKLYVQELETDAFQKEDNDELWYTFDANNPQASLEDYEQTFYYYTYKDEYQELTFNFPTPYEYQGKDLLITIVKECADVPDADGNFTFIYRNGISTSKTRIWASDDQDFTSYLAANNYRMKNADSQSSPAIRFEYSRTHAQAPAETTLTVGEAGYTTFVTPMSIDFTQTPDVQAFIATKASSTKLTLARVDAAAQGTPLVIKAAAGTYTLKKASTEADEHADNLLQASYGYDVNAGWSRNCYALSQQDGEVGFYRVNNTKSGNAISGFTSIVTIPAGKAYLNASDIASGANSFLSFDEEETTGIQSVEKQKATDDAYYNLKGQRVEHPTKGIYIRNGQKRVVK